MNDAEAKKEISKIILKMDYPDGIYHSGSFNDADSRKHLALYRAASALRERIERAKGCEYCNDPDTEYGAISFPRTETGEFDIDKVEAVEAYFFPNCGRELKPKEAANE